MTNEELERGLRGLEDLHGGDWATDVARRAKEVASTRASGAARVRLVDGCAVVRVTLTTPGKGQGRARTVSAGVDVLSQLMDGLLHGVPAIAVTGASEMVREALVADGERLRKEVSARSDALCSDGEKVAEVRAKLAGQKERKQKTEFENLVLTMTDLLSRGWTRELLVQAIDQSVVRHVMTS